MLLFSSQQLPMHEHRSSYIAHSNIWLLQYHHLFGLADGTNFYCSSHELFDPTLKEMPHVTLSNNDSCIISRSKIAKQLGYKMSEKAFEAEKRMKADGVRAFSSNYEYVQSMSDRVFDFVSQFCYYVERYSIDELFLLFKVWDADKLPDLAREIVYKTGKGVGMPICIGLAPTKTLAKVANKLAKKRTNCKGAVVLQTEQEIREALIDFPVEDLWGVGSAYASFLSSWNIYTALDLAEMPEYWVKQHMNITGQRLWYELRGVSCIPLEDMPPDKKNITTSRSFAKPLGEYDMIAKHLSNHAVQTAYKLRRDGLSCRAISIFIQTNRFRTEHAQYNAALTIALDVPTNATRIIVQKVHECLRKIYKPGYLIKKTGVMALDLVPESHQQTALILDESKANHEVESKLSKAMDMINNRFGRGTVLLGAQGTEKQLKLRADKLCPFYTTRIEDVIKVTIG